MLCLTYIPTFSSLLSAHNGDEPPKYCGGSASNSNIEILERFQSEVLRIITDAPRYVPNAVTERDLKVLSVRQEVLDYSVTYRQRLDDNPNRLAKSLFQRTHYNRRLKRYYPGDLATRF